MLGGQLIPPENEPLHEKLLKIIVEDNNRKHEESLKRYRQLRQQKIVTFTKIGLKQKKEMAMVVSQSIGEMKKRKQETSYKAQVEYIIREEEKKQREESMQFKIKEYLSKISLQKEKEKAIELAKSKVDHIKQQSSLTSKDGEKKQINKVQNKDGDKKQINKVQNKAVQNEPSKKVEQNQRKQGNSFADLFQSKENSKNGSIFSFSQQCGDKTAKVQNKGPINLPQQSKQKDIKNIFNFQSTKSPFGIFSAANMSQPNTTSTCNMPTQNLFSGISTNSLFGNTQNNKQSQPNLQLGSNTNSIFAKKNQPKLNTQSSTPLFGIFNSNIAPETKNSLFGPLKYESGTPQNLFKRQQQSGIDLNPSSPEAKQKLVSNQSNSMLGSDQFGMKSSSSKQFVLNSINGSSPSSIWTSPK